MHERTYRNKRIHFSGVFNVIKQVFILFLVLGILISGCSSSSTNNTPMPGRNTQGDAPETPDPENKTEPVLVLQENFEAEQDGGLYAVLNNHPKLTVKEGTGRNQSKGLEARYVGYDRGSERIVREYALGERGETYTLCYDIRFDDDFQFVRGGKIMGLGPDNKVTGGNAVTPGAWSARSNFAENGKVHTYIYSQNKEWKWGESEYSDGPAFQKGGFQRVTLQVELNNPPSMSNGVSRIYIDGALKVTHKDIQYRKVAGDSTLVSKLMFETFHGGNVPSYAPRDEQGNYTTVKAYFDNIEVYRGLQVCR